MSRIKVALIGTGQIASKIHIFSLKALQEVEVVAACDTSGTLAESFAADFGIEKHFSSHLEMLDAVKPDAVIISVPNKYHADITCDALNSGCHVYCEKPPAISAQEAELMHNTADKAGKLLTYGFHHRHGSNVSFFKSKVDNGDFGELYHAKAQWLRRRGIPGWGSFTNKEIQGGGALIDIGCHMLDLAAYLLGYPSVDYVCASAHDKIGKQGGVGLMGSWDSEKFTVEDCLFGLIRFKNGATLQLDTSFALNMKSKDIKNVQLFGSKLGGSLFPPEIYFEEHGQIIDGELPFVVAENLHQLAMSNFIKACIGKEELLVTSEQGLYVQKLVSALYESAQHGKPYFFER